MRTSVLRSTGSAVLALFITAAAAHAGPPWIAVEIPSNPHHPSTRGASFLVRAYHHSAALDVPMVATAEGLVAGERRTMKLAITKTATPGVFAVRADLPREGAWIVAVTLREEHASATALVTLSREGEVRAVRVPSNRTRDGWTVPRAVTADDIEAELRAAVRLAAADDADPTRHAGLGAGLIALLCAAALARRRVR